MRVVRHDDPATFLSVSEALRAREPVQTNVLGAIAEGVRLGREYDAYLWLTIEDSDEVVGCACRTSPWRMVLSPLDAAAAETLGSALPGIDPGIPGFVGPASAVETVAAAAGWPIRRDMSELLRVLRDYTPPTLPEGRPRLAGDDDLTLVVEWTYQFAADANLDAVGIEESVRSRMGSLWLWEVDGEPVAMAGHAPIVATPGGSVGRLGPVFTPAAHRRRGYGTAITAHLTEVVRAQADTVMLVTDEANPDSNSIYAALGYEQVAEFIMTSRTDLP